MSSSVSEEILDLRHYTAPQLRPVLEAESQVWRSRLFWDFQPSQQLLEQYLDSHMLPGYAATEGGQVTGYAFCVYEEAKAVIGDVFSLRDGTGESCEAEARTMENRLLRHLCELLTNSPQVQRVESQLLLHPSGAHAEAFEQAGFRLSRRLFLIQQQQSILAEPRPRLASHLRLRSWRDEDLQAAGKLITESYRGHPDGAINDQYRTPQGAQRFLFNIVRYSGCGSFSSELSFVIEDTARHELAAMVLCSRVSTQSGHITQVCVHPEYRRQGLARLLLAVTGYSHQRKGIHAISLTVTESNQAAVELYLAEGFNCRHTFDAAVWERRRRL